MGILSGYNNQFKAADLGKDGFDELPVGVYIGRISGVKLKEETKKGPMFSFDVRIEEPAALAKRAHFINFFFDTEGAIKMLKIALNILHFPEVLPEDLETEATRSKFLGIRIKFEISEKDYKGKMYKSTFIKSRLGAPASEPVAAAQGARGRPADPPPILDDSELPF
jgi:hypothetical protein